MEPDAIPPPPAWPAAVGGSEPAGQEHDQQDQHRQLERELARTLDDLQAIQELLEELPALFETKFQQRLEPMLQQQQRLLEDNAQLRQQLLQLQPDSESNLARLRLPLPPAQGQPRRTRLLHAFGFKRAA